MYLLRNTQRYSQEYRLVQMYLQPELSDDIARAVWTDSSVVTQRAYTERTDVVSPRFIRVPGSSDSCGWRRTVADIAQRSPANSRHTTWLAHIIVWRQRSLVVRPRLLRRRQRHVSTVGPSEEAGDRWTVPLCAQPDIRGCLRICCWLELDRRLVAHGRVCRSARRWLSSARHIL